jgi:hypothetical protein
MIFPMRVMRVLPALAPALTGCATAGTDQVGTGPAEPKTHAVVYEVAGTGPVAWIEYVTDGRTTEVEEHDVALPWTKAFTLPADQGPQELSLVVLDRGPVTATIEIDGHVVDTTSSFGGDDDEPMYLTGRI